MNSWQGGVGTRLATDNFNNRRKIEFPTEMNCDTFHANNDALPAEMS